MSEILIPLLEWVSKLLIYLGSAGVIGGFFIFMLTEGQPGLSRFTRNYILLATLLALVAVTVNFYAQVGNFAEAGWLGMIDTDFVTMLWNSPIGTSVMFKVIALSLFLCLTLIAIFRPTPELSGWMKTLAVIGGVLLAASFNLTGHTVELSLVSRILLSLHVLIALLWMGALLPLWQACRVMDIQTLQSLMRRFGLIATGLVGVLLFCGVIMAYQLIGSVSELVNTPYGLLLLAKVLLVAVILGFAAWHKWWLVPQLDGPSTTKRLQHSIMLESLVGLLILGVTVLLSTVVGPAMLAMS